MYLKARLYVPNINRNFMFDQGFEEFGINFGQTRDLEEI